jgi:tyrosine-protein phosphatase SIW14
MAARWQVGLGVAAAAVVAAGPLVYAAHRQTHLRNLRVVEDGAVYRSGQLTPAGLEQVVREKRIRTVVSLRAARVKGDGNPDEWEERFCAARGLRHARIVPRVWGADEAGEVPADEAVAEFLRVADDRSNYPLLVHCFAGVHRTGTMCAVYRMEFHRWPADRAVDEMRRNGFDPLDMQQHIEGYLRGYVPRWQAGGGSVK